MDLFAVVCTFCLGNGLRKVVDSGHFVWMNSIELNSIEALRAGLITVVFAPNCVDGMRCDRIFGKHFSAG